ncbi:DMT family transporter [Vibrio sp. HN007]|uniref:EamA family transporter n=1 Tax=Vibrio iocasae TaxID=3098914 RepID=UPI0035D43648
MKQLMMKSETAVSVIAVLLAMLSITAGASLAKSLFAEAAPVGVTSMRLMFSAVILIIGLKTWQVRLNRSNVEAVILYGFTIAGMNLFLYMAIERIPVGVAIAIELMGPLLVSILFSENRSDYLWAGLAALGILFLLPITSGAPELDPLGLMYAGFAAIFWGFYVVVGKRAGQQHGRQAPSLGIFIASLLVLPVGFESLTQINFGGELVILLLCVALLSSAIPMMLEMKALIHLPTKTYGVLTSGEPVVGAIVSFVILGEELTTFQSLGIATIVMASIGAVLSPGKSVLRNIKISSQG